MTETNSILIVGGGLAGLVAAFELTQRNIHVTIIDQEPEQSLGGQAFWSLGGIFCVNSSYQKWRGVKDSREKALEDWMNTAGFDRGAEDYWTKAWAKSFVDFATDEMEAYLKARGVGFLAVGWAERGAGKSQGHGNSVPRFHLTWGTGPAVLKGFEAPVRAATKKGLVTFKFRHEVKKIVVDETTGAAIGVKGNILEPSSVARGVQSSRKVIDTFELCGRAIIISTGGIGGNLEAVRKWWPIDRLGPQVPKSFVIGVPHHVDGHMVKYAQQAGASVVNMDRMWHYTEGLKNWDPIWPHHGIRVIPGPSSLWLDANGQRLPPYLYPGCDTLATLKYICSTGHDYTWFILTREILRKEMVLSGSEQNPDITGKSYWQAFLQRIMSRWGAQGVDAFRQHGEDFVVEDTLEKLVEGMNKLAEERKGPILDYGDVHKTITARDIQFDNNYSKDAQMMLVNNARNFLSDSFRIAKPHRLLDPAFGPLVAIRMNLLTRKSLGGLQTNLDSNVLRPDGSVFPGLYAAGEAAGFGGGGVHGYSALEGTFLGGCIYSGLRAGRAIAQDSTNLRSRL